MKVQDQIIRPHLKNDPRAEQINDPQQERVDWPKQKMMIVCPKSTMLKISELVEDFKWRWPQHEFGKMDLGGYNAFLENLL